MDGRPWVKSLDVISTPPDEETYYRTDEIELQVTFSEPMDVTGEPGVGFFIGADDQDAQRQATYDRGSGTDTLVFKYAVQEEDTDGDGITVANGWKTNGLQLDEGESIVATDNEEASRYYKGIHDPLEDHKVDGSRSSSPVFVSAKTQRERQPRNGDLQQGCLAALPAPDHQRPVRREAWGVSTPRCSTSTRSTLLGPSI